MGLDGSALEKARRKWFARTLEVVLAAAIPAYLIALFVNRELGFAKALELPLVFASLILAIELLQRLGSTVSRLERRLDAVDSNLTGLLAVLAQQTAGVEVTFYRNHELYEATRRAVEQSTERVYVSYLRDRGPSRGDGGLYHVQACRDWAMRSRRHHFRRVIRDGPEASLTEFIAEELAFARKAAADDHYYQVKVLPRKKYGSETVRVGLYDYDTVFLTYSSDVDSVMPEPRVCSRRFSSSCFRSRK